MRREPAGIVHRWVVHRSSFGRPVCCVVKSEHGFRLHYSEFTIHYCRSKLDGYRHPQRASRPRCRRSATTATRPRRANSTAASGSERSPSCSRRSACSNARQPQASSRKPTASTSTGKLTAHGAVAPGCPATRRSPRRQWRCGVRARARLWRRRCGRCRNPSTSIGPR